ncbi:HNH endonuclease [Carboxydothermus islandicus]|uniref:HNH endonuclease n=1 Tax=Carboxydothermus islandicus TaxID=661089 RepID=A0A1L8D0X0_9THEO|nr:hypothetical protein [Carboxydothermus islandicus]GAV24836.1 HNH endonuclease [Carboxydothermus islandicus]
MFAISPTDIGWYNYFKNNPTHREVNFWTPTPWNIKRLKFGDKFLFLLKAPYRKICGYGDFLYYENLTIIEAWYKFGTRNGVESFSDFIKRFNKLFNKNKLDDYKIYENHTIGCIILSNIILFSEDKFKSPEQLNLTFPTQVVKIKYFDMDFPSNLFEV